MTDDELIARYIEPHPWKRGLDEAWLKDYGVSVWAIVGELRDGVADPADVARGYDVPREAVDAAMAYYRRYKCLIDNRLLANAP